MGAVRKTRKRHSSRFVRDIDIGDGSSKSQPVSSHPPVCERVARSRTRRQDGHLWVGGVPTPRRAGKSPTLPVPSFSSCRRLCCPALAAASRERPRSRPRFLAPPFELDVVARSVLRGSLSSYSSESCIGIIVSLDKFIILFSMSSSTCTLVCKKFV